MELGRQKHPYYVIVAIVAAELNQTLAHCKEINLTASNAQAASARVGNAALGFKVLTHYIDDLASETKYAAIDINKAAHQASLLATETLRVEKALSYFQSAQQKALTAKYAHTLNAAVSATEQKHQDLKLKFTLLVSEIETKLYELKRNLRTANVLASVCRIEACRVDKTYQNIFNNVANKVDDVAQNIGMRVNNAIALFERTTH